MNPIAPYRWEARYDRGGLSQCDVDGWHTSREIDRARLRALVVHGHPSSPITLPLPHPRPDGPAPDEIVIRAMTDLRTTMETGTGARVLVTARWTFIGLRYGPDAWVLQLDPAGHVAAWRVPLAPGAALSPIPCARCGPGG